MMKITGRWTRRALATAAVLALSLGGGATAANAAVGPGGSIITCTISLDNPHPSGHVNGTISAQGRVTCTAMVDTIYIKTYLTKVNDGTVASQTFNRGSVSSGSSVGAKSCSEGPATFRSGADVVVHFPAGYTPAKAVSNHSSTNQYVACGNAFARNGAVDGESGLIEPPVYGTTEITLTAVRD